MSSKAAQKVTVNQFMSITGVNEKLALKLLKASNWKLEQAADRHKAFYEAIYRPGEVGIEGLMLEHCVSTQIYTLKWLLAQDAFCPEEPAIADNQEDGKRGSSITVGVSDDTIVSKCQPQLPQKYARRPLSGHERSLLDSLSLTRLPPNILEISSAGRLPLPPALARALAAKDSLRRPSMQSSKPSDTVVPRQPSTQFSRPPTISVPRRSPIQSLNLSTMNAPRRLADKIPNSFFASNGTASAGTKDTDALGKLFEKYRASTDDENATSVEGTMQYLQDLGVDLETAELFLALEIVQAPGLGELSKDSFVDGWKAIGADTMAKQKAYIAGQVKQLPTDTALFKRVYKHTFVCAKDKGTKALPLENALIYWELLFAPPGKQLITKSCNWAVMWLDFLKAKWTKSVNRDMWNQTLEFFLKVMQDEDLTFWSEDGAWPGVIDDFVAYVKVKRGIVADTMETD